MKKLLLTSAFICGAILGMNAQTLKFLDKEGNEIANGSTYTFVGGKLDESFGKIENGVADGYIEYLIDPKLSIESTISSTITIKTTSYNSFQYQICAGGACIPSRNTLIKNEVNVIANTPLSLELEGRETYQDGEKVEIPNYDILVEAWYNDNPSNKISFTLIMLDSADAGVDGIAADANFVKVVGKSLNFDVVGNANISVYSLSGKTLVNKTVAGSGSISLGNLPKGVYVYKVAGKNCKSGKFIIK